MLNKSTSKVSPVFNLGERMPPQDLENEKSILGCLMMDKEAIVKVIDFLEPQDFWRKSHKDIYSSCLELFEKGESIDILTVSSNLRNKGLLDENEIGGISYLTELINLVPAAKHVSTYAKIVRQKRILRDLISAAYDIQEAALDAVGDPEDLLDQAEQRIFSIAQKGVAKIFVLVKEGLKEAFERIDELSKYKGGLRGVATGFTDLDNKLSGLQKSDLIVLAARPSFGKSALALNIATNITVDKKTCVAIFSLEMSMDQIIDRLIAEQAGIDLWKMRTGKGLSDEDFAHIRQALDSLSRASIYIDDSATMNVLKMRAMTRRLQAQEKKLDLIIVDYLQLIEPRNAQAPIVQQMTEISRSLKSLAKELNVPVLAISQLSRAIEHRTPSKPRLSDLRETGAIEQDADVVLFIYREDKYRETAEKNIAEIIIAKHRNGPVGSINLYFDETRVAFRNLEKGEYPEEQY